MRSLETVYILNSDGQSTHIFNSPYSLNWPLYVFNMFNRNRNSSEISFLLNVGCYLPTYFQAMPLLPACPKLKDFTPHYPLLARAILEPSVDYLPRDNIPSEEQQ